MSSEISFQFFVGFSFIKVVFFLFYSFQSFLPFP